MIRKYIYKGNMLWENGTIVSEPDVFHKLYAIESENPDVGVFKLVDNVVEHFKQLLFSGQIVEIRKIICEFWETGKITYKLRRINGEYCEKNL